METIQHTFGSITVTQRISDGFVNLTDMTKADSNKTGKRLDNFLSLKSTKAYLNALKHNTEIQGIEARQGFQAESWGHIEIAIKFAAYLNPTFEIWAFRTLRQVVTGEFQPVTPDAANSAIQLSSQMQEICNQLSAAHYEIDGFRQTARQFAELLGKERAIRIEWMSHTLNALHASTASDSEIERLVSQIRRELACMDAKRQIEAMIDDDERGSGRRSLA